MKKRGSYTHIHHHHKKEGSLSEKGFFNAEIKTLMSKNEKLVAGVLIGAIVIVLAVTVALLLGKGKEKGERSLVPAGPTPRVNTTPYPTIPPIKDMMVLVNERRFNPQTTTIKAGNSAIFYSIGTSTIVIEGVSENASIINANLSPDEEKEVVFAKQGIYKYRNKSNPEVVGTIIVQ